MAPARNRRGRRAAQATGEALATGEGLTTSKGLAEKDAEAAPALTLVPTDAGAPVSPLAGDAEIGRAGALQAASATATKEVLLSDAAQADAGHPEPVQTDAGHPEPVQTDAMQAAADTGTPVEAAPVAAAEPIAAAEPVAETDAAADVAAPEPDELPSPVNYDEEGLGEVEIDGSIYRFDSGKQGTALCLSLRREGVWRWSYIGELRWDGRDLRSKALDRSLLTRLSASLRTLAEGAN